jgi:hypothetical protein
MMIVTRFEARLQEVIRGGVMPPTDVDALLKYRNPLAVANYFNHPPPNALPNVMCCELEVPARTFDARTSLWLPNDVEPAQDRLAKYVCTTAVCSLWFRFACFWCHLCRL